VVPLLVPPVEREEPELPDVALPEEAPELPLVLPLEELPQPAIASATTPRAR